MRRKSFPEQDEDNQVVTVNGKSIVEAWEPKALMGKFMTKKDRDALMAQGDMKGKGVMDTLGYWRESAGVWKQEKSDGEAGGDAKAVPSDQFPVFFKIMVRAEKDKPGLNAMSMQFFAGKYEYLKMANMQPRHHDEKVRTEMNRVKAKVGVLDQICRMNDKSHQAPTPWDGIGTAFLKQVNTWIHGEGRLGNKPGNKSMPPEWANCWRFVHAFYEQMLRDEYGWLEDSKRLTMFSKIVAAAKDEDKPDLIFLQEVGAYGETSEEDVTKTIKDRLRSPFETLFGAGYEVIGGAFRGPNDHADSTVILMKQNEKTGFMPIPEVPKDLTDVTKEAMEENNGRKTWSAV